MGNNKILAFNNPTSDNDLARKKYVDDQDSGKLSLTGGRMSGNIILRNYKILTSSDPTAEKHLARKKYVDNQDAKKLSLTGGTLTGDVTIGSNKIISSTDPTDDTHLSRKKCVDDQDNLKLNLSGGTVSGITTFQQRVNLDNEIHVHGDKRIYNYQTDNNSSNSGLMLINRDYSDKRYLRKTGGTMLGNIVLGSNKITTISNPINNNDLIRC